MNIDRTVSLMDAGEVAADFNIQLTNDMKIEAYKSENKITNTGDKAWTKRGGLVSVWMLGCFNPYTDHYCIHSLISKMRKEQS